MLLLYLIFTTLCTLITCAAQLVLSSGVPDNGSDERVLRSTGASGGGQVSSATALLPQQRKRKPLTQEQLEERRKKV